MKLIRLCIAGILSLIAVACEKDSGGFVFDQIYVYEDGNLIDAQDLVVELPAGGGSIEKEFVTYGITEVRGVRNVEGISAEFLSNYPPSEDELYETGKYLSQYIQTVRFSAEPNDGKKSREAKVMIVTCGYNGYAAYVSIRQSSSR